MNKIQFDSTGEDFTQGQKDWVKIPVGGTVTVKVLRPPYQFNKGLVLDVEESGKEKTLGLTKNLRKVFASRKVGVTTGKVFKILRTEDYKNVNDFGKEVLTANYKINEL